MRGLIAMNHFRTGSLHPRWKGDDIVYNTLHAWAGRHISKPELCQMCKEKPPYDLANISGEYRRDLSDWIYLCRKCHMVSDGRLEKLHARMR